MLHHSHRRMKLRLLLTQAACLAALSNWAAFAKAQVPGQPAQVHFDRAIRISLELKRLPSRLDPLGGIPSPAFRHSP